VQVGSEVLNITGLHHFPKSSISQISRGELGVEDRNRKGGSKVSSFRAERTRKRLEKSGRGFSSSTTAGRRTALTEASGRAGGNPMANPSTAACGWSRPEVGRDERAVRMVVRK
jgi:hypothetical protein